MGRGSTVDENVGSVAPVSGLVKDQCSCTAEFYSFGDWVDSVTPSSDAWLCILVGLRQDIA